MNITDYLTTDHRSCDDLFAAAEQAVSDEDWEAAKATGDKFLAEMSRHFGMEEDVVFPAFEEATGMQGGPPAMMRIEHQQMRALLAQLRTALDAKDQRAYLGAAETLLVMMQQHNMKEENILYPMTDRALGGEAAGIVGKLGEIKAR